MSGADFSESSDEKDQYEDSHQEIFHLFGRQKPVHGALGGGKQLGVLVSWIYRSPYNFPEIVLPEDLCMNVALLLRDRFNKVFGVFKGVASGKDVKKFLYAILGLWIISIVGSWLEFLTIVYILFVMLLTMPLLYEKHEDQVDAYALKAKAKLKRQYSTLDEMVIKKLPNIPFVSDNKQH
ncbi:hypothetical protein RD792_010215 [Penstemon davidsonii]|uniref:Reticulon-like protein n=1 Tax=Penstemon davidsonii TaxID=160366 RepID=A0ABR0D173_9LAMI|nr:hypothetical protein RD792_010215 [Penstemon davidsonii]